MPLLQTTISGTLYDVAGNVAPNIAVWIHKVTKSGVTIQYKRKKAATSDAAGLVSFTVPRNSTAWISGNFFIGSTRFQVSAGVSIAIPDAATATLESLGAASTIPTQGFTVKSNGASLADLISILDFSTAFTVTESPTGEANVDLAASLIVTTEQVQDALATFFPDSTIYDWTYDDLNNKVGLIIAPFTGDSGAGGVTGLVPAPAAGDAAANKFLKSDGTWAAVAAGSAWGGITGTLSNQTDLQNALNAKQTTDADLDAIAALTPSNDDIIQRKAGAWANRTIAQLKTDLSLSGTNTGDQDLGPYVLSASLAPVALSGSASDLSTGTLPDARFPATLPAASGVNLTALNAANIASGSLADGRLSANIPLKNAANDFSVAGASATPAVKLSGAIFTGGGTTNTKPQLLVEPSGATSTAWSNAGTLIGGNGASGFAGNLIDFQVNGVSTFKVTAAGGGAFSSTTTASTFADSGSKGAIGNGVALQAANTALIGWSQGALFSSNDLTLSRSAAAVLQIGTSAANALGSLLAGRVVAAKTANYPVVAASDNSKLFTNAGASGTVVFTLPTAVPGLTFTFYVDAAFTLQVTAGASTTIRIAASVSAAAGNITNATVGGCVTLVAISATQWVAESSLGTWVVT